MILYLLFKLSLGIFLVALGNGGPWTVWRGVRALLRIAYGSY